MSEGNLAFGEYARPEIGDLLPLADRVCRHEGEASITSRNVVDCFQIPGADIVRVLVVRMFIEDERKVCLLLLTLIPRARVWRIS